MQITDPATRNKGLVIPVWDFFDDVMNALENGEQSYSELDDDPLNSVHSAIITKTLQFDDDFASALPVSWRQQQQSEVIRIEFGFFTMTKAAAAFVKDIYNVIVSVFDGSLLSRNESAPDQVKPIDFAALPTEFESLEAVAEATGRQIVIPGDSDDVLLSFSVHMVGNETLVIRSKYTRTDGKQYAVVQSLYNDSALWSGANSTTEDSINAIELAIGIKAYLSTMEDGTVYAEAFDIGHDLNISSTMLSLEELKEVVLNLKYID